MAFPPDFRLSKFNQQKVNKCGIFLGHRSYWKLYAIENFLRVVINSVLSVEMSKDWWEIAVNDTIRKNVERFKKQYSKQAWRSNPGKHGIYYVNLSDLNEIIRPNVDFIRPVVPKIDEWMLNIEEIRIPRNAVAHMNYPSTEDIKLIDKLYEQCKRVVDTFPTKRIPLEIPR